MLAWSRLKKHWLERQLLNRRASRFVGDSFGDDGGDDKCGCVSGNKVNSLSLRKVLRALTLSELNSLWMAVQSGGARISDCIEVPDSEKSSETDSGSESAVLKALIICYNVLLTPFISEDDLLRRIVPLSWCRLADNECGESVDDQRAICCNPYHYGLVTSDIASSSSGAIDQADEGQSRASRQSVASLNDNDEKREPIDCGDDTGFFTDTSGTHDSRIRDDYRLSTESTMTKPDEFDSSGNRVKPWCHIAYWEENRRSGPLLSVVDNTGLVYFDAPKPPASVASSSLRLASLKRAGDCSDPIRKIRVKIGLGLALFRRKGSVWLYNRSNSCIFVRSNTCFRNRARPLRLNPGCCCRVHQVGVTVPRVGEGPEESPTVLISFVKGWGRSYRRPFITCCPCWVQVIFTS